MPGATLDSASGDEITGKIKVKVGPIQMIYAGKAKFTERDQAAGVVTLEASGKETRGAGTASASVRSQLSANGDSTDVTVHTSLNVTGKPAQFGRGVLEEVGGKLVGIFAANLAAMLAAEPEEAPEAAPAADDPVGEMDPAGNGVGPAGDTQEQALPIDVLNLTTRAWSSLRQDGIQTLGDLTRRTEQQLRAIDGVGPASLADIRTKLADRGLVLAEAAESGAAGPAKAPRPDVTPEPADANGHHPAGKHAGADQELADVTPLHPARHEAPAAGQRAQAAREPSTWQPDNDAIDLLDVAGLPVLKRAAPAIAAVVAVLLVLLGLRRRKSRRR
jgi:carbon monoxide dehydrogenase subunit G